MMTLVLGGAASGKSAFAEELAAAFDAKNRIYLATMQPSDGECVQRIHRHRLQRAEKHFTTVECYTGLGAVRLPFRGVVLLECMSNLVANEMYAPQGAGENTFAAVMDGVHALLRQSDHLVVVSNELFGGGADYDPSTLHYLRTLGQVNIALARLAQQAVEVTAGVPIWHKGGEQ